MNKMKYQVAVMATIVAAITLLEGNGSAKAGTISTDNQIIQISQSASMSVTPDPHPSTSGTHCHNKTAYYPALSLTYQWGGNIMQPPAESGTLASVQLDTSTLSGSKNDKVASCTVTAHYYCPYDGEETETNVETTPDAHFTVCDVKSSTSFSAPDGTPDTRTTVGVGEPVAIFVVPSELKATWSLSCDGSVGNDNRLSPSYGNTTNYTAAGKACSETISAAIDGGPTIPKSFSIIEPANEVATKKFDPDNDPYSMYPSGVQGVGMLLDIIVHPRNVSFQSVQMIEIGEYASNVQGYFTQFDGIVGTTGTDANGNRIHPYGDLTHYPTPTWINLDQQNWWSDTCFFGGFLPDWSWGQFEWDIPVQWRVDPTVIASCPTGSLSNRLQHMEILGADGTSYISKLSQNRTRKP